MIQFDKIKGILCDMDGVIYHGNNILPGAADFIEWLKKEKKEFSAPEEMSGGSSNNPFKDEEMAESASEN